jgi:catechol-2,3-dioxygenase
LACCIRVAAGRHVGRCVSTAAFMTVGYATTTSRWSRRPDLPHLDQAQALNHVAIGFATFQAWQRQIAFLRGRGVALHGRGDRGVTHSIHLTDPNG